MGNRLQKSFLNIKYNLVFYLLTLFISFFSRKIFLEYLGVDFIGLTSTLYSILGFLNLAELGIGSAVSYFLYKPLIEQNRDEINKIVSFLGYLYRKIGIFILSAGIIFSLFFPLIFKNTTIEISIIYFVFFSFLGSALIGYFINYRQLLLTADQKNYIVSIYFQSSNIIKVLFQIWLAYHYRNLYIWVFIEFVFSIIACIILNNKIDKEYPWLCCNITKGKKNKNEFQPILVKVKQIFIHRIKDFLLTKSDEILVFAFVSLKMVAYYGNYTLIASKLSLIFTYALDSIGSGVGNLVAENNIKNTTKVFWELMCIRHFIAGIVCILLFFILTPFIEIWLGKEYILDNTILSLLLISIYIMLSRATIDNFNQAYGLYSDTWSAWVELILNVSITISTAPFWGIKGILLGKIISLFIVVVLWKPLYLFSYGLKLPVIIFWKGYIRYFIINLFSLIILYIASSCITNVLIVTNWINFIIYSFLLLIIYLVINIPLFYYFGYGTKNLLSRFFKL